MTRVLSALLAIVVGLFFSAASVMASETVVELLRLQVPASQRQVWLDAEGRTWQPWLEQQQGFLGRDLYWDPAHEQGVLMIRWATRAQWKAISVEEVNRVQEQFDREVNAVLNRSGADQPAFPLVAEAELVPLQ